MSVSRSEIVEFFDKHAGEYFELVFLKDFNSREHPNHYKAIFKNLKTGKFYTTFITPGMIKNKYRVGYHYRNGFRLKYYDDNGVWLYYNKYLLHNTFTVNSKYNSMLTRMSNVVSIKDMHIENFFLKEYVYVEVQDDFTLIIPSFVIANRFYYSSVFLTKAVLQGRLELLYYKDSIKNIENEIDIYENVNLNKKVCNNDEHYIRNFISNPYSRKMFNYIFFQNAIKESDCQPIKVHFPVDFPFKISADYKDIGKDDRGKPKYLVLNIGYDELESCFFNEDYFY